MPKINQVVESVFGKDFDVFCRKLNLREETVSGIDERGTVKNYMLSSLKKVLEAVGEEVDSIRMKPPYEKVSSKQHFKSDYYNNAIQDVADIITNLTKSI